MIAARAVVVLAALFPVAATFAALRYYRRNVKVAGLALLFGAIAFIPAELFERWVEGWSGLDEHAKGPLDLAALLYAFVIAAPLEQGLKLAAVAPLWRSRRIDSPLERVTLAGSAALGFVTLHNIEFLFERGLHGVDLARAFVAVPAHVFCAATWGYALGRDRKRRFGDRAFNVTWLAATIFNGIFDHIVFARSPLALLATVPLLGAMAFIAWMTWGNVARRTESERARPRRFSIAPPSIGAVRAALRRTERPVMWRWIVIGALVTTGVLTTTIALSVVVGHRIGIDFAAVDRPEASSNAVAPLLLLGAAALAAFPIAGWLVARASTARGVLEPAIASGVAIAGCLVLLGLAAPVAVVFAVAFAPIAFGLACAGAWMGMSR